MNETTGAKNKDSEGTRHGQPSLSLIQTLYMLHFAGPRPLSAWMPNGNPGTIQGATTNHDFHGGEARAVLSWVIYILRLFQTALFALFIIYWEDDRSPIPQGNKAKLMPDTRLLHN